MQHYDPFCLSSYLTFRYVVETGRGWTNNIIPTYPNIHPETLIPIQGSDEVLQALEKLVTEGIHGKKVGLLLSGGIDSAILGALLPEQTHAYTIRFVAEGALDESPAAAEYARRMDLNHRIIEVTWEDYELTIDDLMRHKKSPLHPVEPGLYKAARTARSDGCDVLIVGNGADSTFGGMDKLLSKDWEYEEFINRYSFINASEVLAELVNMESIYAPYRKGDGIDVIQFLKVVHGIGIIQAFHNALSAADCSSLQPFENLVLNAPLDLARIRAGESKYMLRTVFEKLYPGMKPPEKIPFARPMDIWMAEWQGPKRSEFIHNLEISGFSGEQKWLIYSLERFLNLMEGTCV